MRQITRTRAASICSLSLLAALTAACGNDNNHSSNNSESPSASASTNASSPAASEQSKDPVTISLTEPDLGRVWKDDNAATKELETRTNVNLKVTMYPNNDFNSKYTVLAASGDIPDLSRLGGFDYQNYADQGLFMDLTDLIDKYGPNLKQNIPADLWDLTKYKGKQFVIPYENVAGKEVPVVRKDWLDKLQLKAPTNLDEFEAMLKAFTFNDPDGNGKNDTYGMGITNSYSETFMPIFGAYGIAPGLFGGSTPMASYVKDNTIVPVAVSPEYKAALEYIKKLWDEKVVDPELFTIKSDQALQKVAQGKIGYFNAWWSIAPQQLTQQLKMNEIVPEAKWDPILPGLTGPDGKSGMYSFGNVGAGMAISAKSKHPEEAIQFLDYLSTQEGWELARLGVKGTHYTEWTAPRTDEGQKAYDEKWLDPLSQIVSRVDLVQKLGEATKDPVEIENNRFINAASSYTLYQDVFYGVPLTDEHKTYGADVAKFEEEMFIKFVTGKESLDKWDDYVEAWKKKGGKSVLDSKVAKYNELKGTQMVSGV
ncbi:extracellular solute-binding protein [Paenibacillus glycanilyticus]|uniref:Lipoprotein LipO n=1 Tax=Paenibacillus glycanilyticus TaxID=126569 RepID=A0ABQ6GN03_9BACL|nr:extracellular solute-binding protein [Paenibacillus glycanilyticus]GLX71016.1 lipoprotein LipO [Paenibacillus glycanilyticus]